MTETTRQPTSQPTSQQPSAPRGPYRVVIVDDHAMFRTGVKAEIGRSVAVVGEAADADRAIVVILQTQPDVVLLDVHLPGGGGVEVHPQGAREESRTEVPRALGLRRR